MRFPVWILALMLGIGLVACSDDDPVAPCDSCDEYPLADSPDQVIANFERAFTERNPSEYSTLLHPEFRFVYSPEILVGLKALPPLWTRDIELTVMGDAFYTPIAGEEGNPPSAQTVADIAFELFEPLDEEWESQAGVGGLENAYRMRYEMRARVSFRGEEVPVLVHGEQWLFVEPMISGEETMWQVKLWLDATREDKAGTESESWSAWKMRWGDLFLPEPVTLAQPSDEAIADRSIELNWSASNASDFAEYRVVITGPGITSRILTSIQDRNTTTLKVESLDPSTEYSFRVDVKTHPGWIRRSNSVTVTTDEQQGFPPATTPDRAMQNFLDAWETMNLAEYSQLLHDEFQFFFDPADLDQGLDWVWARESEMAAVGSMFGGWPGQDPITGEPIPPIQGIDFDIFTELDPGWMAPPDEPIYQGTLRMRYRVSITVSYQGGTNSTRVSGVNYIYVANVGGVADDARWQIKVWEDRSSSDAGNKAASEESSWGAFKARWGL